MSLFDFSAPPAPKDSGKAEATRRIKQWVELLSVPGEDGIVHVAELQCHEAGCPDFETVITLMSGRPQEDRTMKIPKPLAEVTQEEVTAAVLHCFAAGPPDGTAPRSGDASGHHC
jgi:hypothetical protein